MATEITKEKLFNDLNELKDALELPNVYLANYFNGLRNDVDRAFAPKQLTFQNDQEKKKQLDELEFKKKLGDLAILAIILLKIKIFRI